MSNYQNGKIYKIEDVGGNMCYIGSTTKLYLSHRMATHRGDYKKWKEGKGNKLTAMDIFEKYGVENCRIVLIELFQCQSKDELHKREAHYITTTECVNKQIPGRTLAEYYQDNKERIQKEHNEYYAKTKEARKLYQETNKAKINERKTEVINCECGKHYGRGSKSQHFRTNYHIENFKPKDI